MIKPDAIELRRICKQRMLTQKATKELFLVANEIDVTENQANIVETLWDAYKPILFSGDTSEDGLAIAAEVNLPLLEEMNAVVKLYEQQAK